MENYTIQSETQDKANLKWNWGAFMMPLQFGIGNKAYLCLLALIPILSFIWIFVAGAKGAKWAFESGDFDTVKEFNASMKTWNRAGAVMAIICAIAIAVYVVLLVAISSSIMPLIN